MLCQSCEKFQATLHQLDVVYDDAGRAEVLTSNFCPSCAKRAGLPVPKATAYPKIMSMLSKAFLSPLNQATAGKAAPEQAHQQGESTRKEAEGPSCPHCGWTLRDLKQTQRLGCPHDYDIFADYLSEMFERLHGFDRHVPLEQDEKPLDRLHAAMARAIQEEDYEAAARLRDRIQDLEKGDATSPGKEPRP